MNIEKDLETELANVEELRALPQNPAVRRALNQSIANVQEYRKEIAKMRAENASEAVHRGFDPQGWSTLDPDQKTEISRLYRSLKPPYSPEVDDEEVERVLEWISQQDQHVQKVNDDPVYNFVYLVAGHVGETVERMLKYDVNKRRSAQMFFDVPGVDIAEQLQKAQKKVADDIIQTEADLEERRVFDVLKHHVDLIEASILHVPRPAPVRDLMGPIVSNAMARLRVYKDLDPDTAQVTDDANTPSRHGLARYMNQKGNRIDATYQGMTTGFLARGAQLPTNQFAQEADVGKVQPYLIYHSYSGYTASEDNTPRSEEDRELSFKLEQLRRVLSVITEESRRRRDAATLNWLERSEVLKTADMNEEMFMGLNRATSLVITRVPGLRALQREAKPEEILLNHSDRTFLSYFADLTGRLIQQIRFFEGARGAFDRNHARLGLLNDRVLHALRGFAYVHGKIVSTASATPAGAERIAFT